VECRVKITPLRTEDAFEIVSVLSAPEIYEFISDRPPQSVDELRKRYQTLAKGSSPDGSETWLNWIVRDSVSGTAMGYVQATVSKETKIAQIAYVLNPGYWGQGFGSEAIAEMLSILTREYGVHLFEASINLLNQRSIRLMERLGFRKTGERISEAANGTSDEFVFSKVSHS
jgi:RimJ/RimL family protein N-acetyltransferase